MKKKIILGIITMILVGMIIWISSPKEETLILPEKGEITPVALTKEEKETIQRQLYSEGFGTVYKIYALDENRYLYYGKEKDEDYGNEYPADQLMWVERTKDGFSYTSVYQGSYPINLVLANKQPYFEQDRVVYFVFFEGKGEKNMEQKGKGYVYEVLSKTGIKKQYETTHEFYKFGLNKEKKMVLVEKQEMENRNLYPSYLAPYRLNYLQFQKDKWTKVQEKYVSPDIVETYEQYLKKHNEK